MRQLLKVADGFLKKNTKAFKPDKETGKWRGAETKNGNFATIKPGWTGDLKINGKKYTLDLWGFNTKWGVQSMFYKVTKVKNDEKLEDIL